jgi:hypothetical protein
MICWECRAPKEIVYTDEVGRGYCAECSGEDHRWEALQFLLATIPYQVGDRVECRTAVGFELDYTGREVPTAAVYDGIGHIVEVSFNPEVGATLVVPMFRVQLDDKAYPEAPDFGWYSEPCLTPVKVDA